jgi:hypothetical protein
MTARWTSARPLRSPRPPWLPAPACPTFRPFNRRRRSPSTTKNLIPSAHLRQSPRPRQPSVQCILELTWLARATDTTRRLPTASTARRTRTRRHPASPTATLNIFPTGSWTATSWRRIMPDATTTAGLRPSRRSARTNGTRCARTTTRRVGSLCRILADQLGLY